MPTYILLSTLTSEGVQTVKNNPQRIKEVNKEIEAVHRSYKRELVPWQPPGEVLAMRHAKPLKIQIEKRQGH